MKKTINYAILALFTLSVLFYACKKENASIPKQANSRVVASESQDVCDLIYDDIGIIHNQALEYSFNKIKNENLFAGVTDEQAAISLMTNLANEYLSAYFSYTYSNSYTNDMVNAVLNNPNPTSNYSAVFNQKMSEVMDAYNTAADVAAYKTFAISYLQNNISSIPANEQVAFRSAILISYNSWEYWNDNLLAWINEYNEQNDLPEVSYAVNPRNVGKADIEGCVSGAILGAGGGPAGFCLGATTGAIYGSAVNAVFQCLFPNW